MDHARENIMNRQKYRKSELLLFYFDSSPSAFFPTNGVNLCIAYYIAHVSFTIEIICVFIH